MSAMGFIPDVLFIFITLYLMHRYQEKILGFLKKGPLVLTFLIFTYVLIVVEENINCGAFDCQYSFFPFTLWFLLGLVCVAALFARKFGFRYPLLGLIIVGVLWEVFAGGLYNVDITPGFYTFMLLYVGISYAYISYLPLKMVGK